VDNEFKPALKNGKLCDVAPTVLKLMGVDVPVEMDGASLF
jgi:2,3-bisphosphoglycerate-independent phosphoglycerate mutase